MLVGFVAYFIIAEVEINSSEIDEYNRYLFISHGLTRCCAYRIHFSLLISKTNTIFKQS